MSIPTATDNTDNNIFTVVCSFAIDTIISVCASVIFSSISSCLSNRDSMFSNLTSDAPTLLIPTHPRAFG